MIFLYVVAGSAAIWGTFVLTRKYSGLRTRRALISLVASMLFAPSMIGAGHGFAFGPAWYAAYQQASLEGGSTFGFWMLGLAPILTCAAVFLGAGEIWLLVRKKRSGGAG